MTISAQAGQSRPTAGAARRLTVRALKQVRQLTDPAASATLLAMVGLWLTRTGPAWLTTASDWTILLYAVAILGTKTTADAVVEHVIDLIDPDRWDGDITFELAEGLTQLRADIDNGADIDDVLDSLRASNLVPELLSTLRNLAAEYAARGDDEENQRLVAAVLHLRNADKTIGYGSDLDAREAAGTYQKYPQ
ncbi:hypothetical protein QCN29_32470 [Streptomyces sp. HNM0663]|uniref:Uncharacterized protein n=1 Tax=Streptomyces chengmaiensis TaxID=3040919 RepID=A0ABT6HXG7_9ACTN|nr:hypothetical protein [Streptomyces chengmaiensis]MDH2393398.1 hypothetical protein [Streptomyces chengmaiensis]